MAFKEEIRVPATQGNKSQTRINRSYSNEIDSLPIVLTPTRGRITSSTAMIFKKLMGKKTQETRGQLNKRFSLQRKRQRKTIRTTQLPTRMQQSQVTTPLLLVNVQEKDPMENHDQYVPQNINTSSTIISIVSTVSKPLRTTKQEKKGILAAQDRVGEFPKTSIQQQPSATICNPNRNLQPQHTYTTGAPPVSGDQSIPNMPERVQGVEPTAKPVLENSVTSKQVREKEQKAGMANRHQGSIRHHIPKVEEDTLKMPLTGFRKCNRGIFNDILLIIIYNSPLYDSIPLLMSFYEEAFPHIIICGSEPSQRYKIFVVKIEKGFFGYECAAQAMRVYRQTFNGYLYINDDMIVNWWNFVDFDKGKIWFGAPWLSKAGITATYNGNKFISTRLRWHWWYKTVGKNAFERAFREMRMLKSRTVNHWNITRAFKILEKNGNGSINCFKGLSDIFYIPKQFATTFSHISKIFFRHRVFLEIAVPMMISMLDERSNNIHLTGVYIHCHNKTVDCRPVILARYNPKVAFIHPFKLNSGDLFEASNKNILQNWATPISRVLTKC